VLLLLLLRRLLRLLQLLLLLQGHGRSRGRVVVGVVMGVGVMGVLL